MPTTAIREHDYPDYNWDAEKYIPSVDAIIGEWEVLKDKANNRIQEVKIGLQHVQDQIQGSVLHSTGLSVYEWSEEVFRDVSARNFINEVVSDTAERYHSSILFNRIEKVETAADALKDFIKAPIEFLTEELPNFGTSGSEITIEDLNGKIDAIYENRKVLINSLDELFGLPVDLLRSEKASDAQAANFFRQIDKFGIRVQFNYSDTGIYLGGDEWSWGHGMSGFDLGLSIKGAGGVPYVVADDHSYLLIDGAISSSLNGGKYSDLISGGGGADSLNGMEGDDYLNGGAGNDFINATNGNDTLVGGSGIDQLATAAGDHDVFQFEIGDSGVGKGYRDTIFNIDGGDLIDISAIDANRRLKGNQTFVWEADGDEVLSLGEAQIIHRNGAEILQLNFKGNYKADFEIALIDSDGSANYLL